MSATATPFSIGGTFVRVLVEREKRRIEPSEFPAAMVEESVGCQRRTRALAGLLSFRLFQSSMLLRSLIWGGGGGEERVRKNGDLQTIPISAQQTYRLTSFLASHK